MGLFDELGDISEVEQLCREMRKNNMKGLEKFKKEIEAEVQKSCYKDDRRRQLIQGQANAIIKHIESVCDEEYDKLLAQDHKSFRRMWSFVTKNAKEYAIDNCAMVADNVVYGWIDEYVGRDDKAEVEKEKKEAEKSKSNPVSKTTTKSTAKTVTKTTTKTTTTTVEDKWEQVSIFDLI